MWSAFQEQTSSESSQLDTYLHLRARISIKTATNSAEHGQNGSDRMLLSAYNAYCGILNDTLASNPKELIAELRPIECMAREAKNRKILGLVLRQKSEQLQTLGRYHSALEDAEQSAHLLELHGAKADYDLALIQKADCAIDLGQPHLARKFLERLMEPVDNRVEFPLALVRARLGFSAVPNPRDFAVVVPASLIKWERHRAHRMSSIHFNKKESL